MPASVVALRDASGASSTGGHRWRGLEASVAASTIISMDHHAVAAVSLTGICLDVLGGLYLAYDLLGGQHGPLRLLTKMVTYSIVFGIGYVSAWFFFESLPSRDGITIAIELHRTASQHDHYPLRWEAVFSAIRASAFGAGLYRILGAEFASYLAFSSRQTNIRLFSRDAASLDYGASCRPRLTRRHLWELSSGHSGTSHRRSSAAPWGTSITHGHSRFEWTW